MQRHQAVSQSHPARREPHHLKCLEDLNVHLDVQLGCFQDMDVFCEMSMARWERPLAWERRVLHLQESSAHPMGRHLVDVLKQHPQQAQKHPRELPRAHLGRRPES